MKVLFAAAESAPFVRTGGLAEVIGSLPKELRKQQIDVRVVIPKHGEIAERYRTEMTKQKEITVPLSWRKQYCGIESLEYNGVPFYFIDNEYYFKRRGLYGFGDDAERYAFFCRAVIEMLPHLDFTPQIIHCHDWHTSLISLFLRRLSYGENIRTLFTIHNLKYQGVFSKTVLGDVLGLGDEYFTKDSLEFYDQVNYMKAGIIYSDLITTVSPTYSQEILAPYFGEKLDGLLKNRSDNLYGILNGIDYDIYNPGTDQYIFANYDAESALTKKAENKKHLQQSLGLPVRADVPVIAVISRLAAQKGLDLLIHVLEEMLAALDIQMIVMGSGERRYQDLFAYAADKYPDKMAVNFTYQKPLAHQIYAASDIFLMPSLFEPCGLGQMIALRYGSVPVVRETGGLKDTVRSFNEISHQGNGFSFVNYNAHEMLFAVQRALRFYQDKDVWQKIVREAMSCDYSWCASAKQYIDLYHCLLAKNTRGN